MEGSVSRGEKDFPEKVYQFSPDVKTLYYQGNLALAEAPAIAVVGSRKCTVYGRTIAKNLGERMARNHVTLVSGLAKGIDTCGHESILSAGGKTIAVLGGGVSRYYPAENRFLQQQIGQRGLLLSEHPPHYQARAFDFPKRNRIISALSEGVVVVEAPNRSGALITAECAMEQGKQVYGVPGNITSYYSFGTNKLIREGALPLILLDDLFTDLGIGITVEAEQMELLSIEEKKVIAVLQKQGEASVDEITVATGFLPRQVYGVLTALEMKGMIFSAMGKFFVANY